MNFKKLSLAFCLCLVFCSLSFSACRKKKSVVTIKVTVVGPRKAPNVTDDSNLLDNLTSTLTNAVSNALAGKNGGAFIKSVEVSYNPAGGKTKIDEKVSDLAPGEEFKKEYKLDPGYILSVNATGGLKHDFSLITNGTLSLLDGKAPNDAKAKLKVEVIQDGNTISSREESFFFTDGVVLTQATIKEDD